MFNNISNNTLKILEKASQGIILTRNELLHLINLDENSFEANALIQTSRYISQKRFGSKAMLLCQSGIEAFPCIADCVFCSFGKSHFSEELWKLSDNDINTINNNITNQGVYAHFLLFMHNSEFKNILHAVEKTKQSLPLGTKLVLNCGDIEKKQLEELKCAGVSGAYHVLRLGEGRDTALSAQDRIKTIENIRDLNMEWYTCCEPIGPEHSNEEIIDQILLAQKLSCFQNAVMRRISVTKEMQNRGIISLLRSAQIVAIVILAMNGNQELSSIAIHEPDLLGLYAGANCIYAEFGVNPRDNTQDTTKSRGYSVKDCKTMLKECGYKELMQANGQANIIL